MRGFPSQSIHCCVTSPPYFGLRDYGVEGQIGLEKTVGEYVERLVEVFREVKRVLRDDGTFWLNLGDSYGGCRGNITPAPDNKHRHDGADTPGHAKAGTVRKNLIGMPWRVAFALQADGWILRSDIIWAKGNPMPESVTDRPTRSHEYVFLFAKSPHYFYDSEAIKEEGVIKAGTKGAKGGKERSEMPGVNSRPPEYKVYDGMRNKRSVWNVNTRPYKGAHFATFPPDLIEPCLLAGTSEMGCCSECDKPWSRVVEKEREPDPTAGANAMRGAGHFRESVGGPAQREGRVFERIVSTKTIRWEKGCGHPDSVAPCTVLDPFAGSGTVGEVALKHGRNAVLIELNPQYCELIEKRCGSESVVWAQK